MSLFSDEFTVNLPYDDAFAAAGEALTTLGGQIRNNGIVLDSKTHQEVYYPVTMRIAIIADGDSTRFELSGSNMGLGMMQKKIGKERFSQVREAIEAACAAKAGLRV